MTEIDRGYQTKTLLQQFEMLQFENEELKGSNMDKLKI